MAALLGCYALLAAGLASGLALFITLKGEFRRFETRWSKRQSALEEAVQAMCAEIETLAERVKEAEERAGVLVPPTPPKSGLNLGKRSQALRMFRRGEMPEQIAAALDLPQNEVELLIKVHRISLETLAPEP